MNCVQPQGGRLDRESGERTRRHFLRRRFRRDHGATVVEYALGVALICVASIGALQFLQDESGDHYTDRADRAGAPDLALVADGGSTDGAADTGGSDGTDGEVEPDEVFFGGFTNLNSTGNSSKWTAKIEVNVRDAANKGVDGVQVDGFWTLTAADGLTSTIPATCNQSSPQGVCKFQLSDLGANLASVTFTMTDMSGGVPEVVYNGTEQVSLAITKPVGGGPN